MMKRFFCHQLLWMTVALLWISGGPAGESIKPKDPSQQPDIAYRYPVITAPRLASAPTVDGVIDRAEWSGAAQSAPLVTWHNDPTSTFGENQACYWVGYTDTALHIAWRFDRPNLAITPRAEATEFDSPEIWGDDKIEILIRPGVGTPGQGYNLVINALGMRADRYNNRLDWSEPLTSAARVTENGWEEELSFPFKSMGRATPQPGETWEILLLNNPVTPANVVFVNSFVHDWRLKARDGFLDEEYPVRTDTITLTIPQKSYRLIRVEAPRL